MTRKDMARRAAWAFALWLAALFTVCAPAQAAHHVHHHRHHSERRQSLLRGRQGLPPTHSNDRRLGQYLPPNTAFGVTNVIQPGDTSYAVSQGDSISYYAKPGQHVTGGDVVTLTVTYLYQNKLGTSWLVGTHASPLIFKASDANPNVPRLACVIPGTPPIGSPSAPATSSINKLIFVTDSTIQRGTASTRSVSAEAVNFDTSSVMVRQEAYLPRHPARKSQTASKMPNGASFAHK